MISETISIQFYGELRMVKDHGKPIKMNLEKQTCSTPLVGYRKYAPDTSENGTPIPPFQILRENHDQLIHEKKIGNMLDSAQKPEFYHPVL